MRDELVCDRCGTVILTRSPLGDHEYVFERSAEESDLYESVSRRLCYGCVEDLLAWIDDAESERSRVETADLQTTAEALITESARLKIRAKRLKELSEGDADE